MSRASAQRLSFDERRARIIDAACSVIAARGVDAFRILDVAEAAGVSQPLVSRHFRSRAELVLAAFVRSDERALAILDERTAHVATGRERVLVYLLGTLDDEDPELRTSWELWREVWTHGSPSKDLRRAVHDRQLAWLTSIETYIRQGQADGSVVAAADAARAALFLTTMVDGLHPSLRVGILDRPAAEALLHQAVQDRLD